MITPEQMAKLAAGKPNPYVERFEREIEEAATDGLRCVLLCYTGCSDEMVSAVRELERRGFRITVRSERCGGVWQHPGYYAEW